MKIRTTRSKQNGMTYLGMLILLIFIAFIAIIVIKVVPVYLENFKVESSLTSLAQEPKDQLSTTTPGQLETLLMKRLEVNDVEHVKKDNIKITKEGPKTVIDVSYEVRVPLFLNIDLIAKFPENRVELGGP
jgi:maltodextrin utilization protein YvdJ